MPSYLEWSGDDWHRYLTRSFIPRQIVAQLVGTKVDYRILDTSANARLENSVCRRCEFVSGLFFAAKDAGLIGSERAAVIVGIGPTAVILLALAAIEGIPVVHVTFNGTELMYPLAGCERRWICPEFYERTFAEPATSGREWIWRLPKAFKAAGNSQLEAMREFHYAHEPAGAVARRWAEIWRAIESVYAPRYRSERTAGGSVQQLHEALTKGAAKLGVPACVVFDCRFAAGERTKVFAGDDVIYTSISYWDSDGERWRSHPGTTVVSGSGDAAAQDFLRAVWNWDSLTEAREVYLAACRECATAQLAAAVHALDTTQAPYRDELARIDFKRLDDVAAGERPVATIEAEVKAGQIEAFKPLARLAEGHGKILAQCWHNKGVRAPREDVFLHSRKRLLSPCYLHNAVFLFATLELLRLQGRECWLVCDELALAFKPEDSGWVWNARYCAENGRAGGLSAAGKTDLSYVLLRYGPAREKLIASN